MLLNLILEAAIDHNSCLGRTAGRPLALTDAKALLQAVSGDRLEALYTVALSMELRQSEALGLRWSDVDLDGRNLSVSRSLQREDKKYKFLDLKSSRSHRTIPLPDPVVASLRKHRARQAEDRLRVGSAWEGGAWGALVYSTETGGPLSGSSVTKRFKRLLAAAGLPDMVYHELRHAAVSLMAAQGIPARTVMEILGHSQISTTMNVYAHVASDVQREAADRIGKSLFG